MCLESSKWERKSGGFQNTLSSSSRYFCEGFWVFDAGPVLPIITNFFSFGSLPRVPWFFSYYKFTASMYINKMELILQKRKKWNR